MWLTLLKIWEKLLRKILCLYVEKNTGNNEGVTFIHLNCYYSNRVPIVILVLGINSKDMVDSVGVGDSSQSLLRRQIKQGYWGRGACFSVEGADSQGRLPRVWKGVLGQPTYKCCRGVRGIGCLPGEGVGPGGVLPLMWSQGWVCGGRGVAVVIFFAGPWFSGSEYFMSKMGVHFNV